MNSGLPSCPAGLLVCFISLPISCREYPRWGSREEVFRSAVRADGLKGGEVKELFSSIGVAIALLGRAEPAIDVLPGSL